MAYFIISEALFVVFCTPESGGKSRNTLMWRNKSVCEFVRCWLPFLNPITECSPLASREQESVKRSERNKKMVRETEVRHYLRHCMHSSKVHSPYSAVRRRDRRSWILTLCLFPTALSIRFHFSSHSNTNLISLTVERHLRALQFSTQIPPHLSNWPIFPGGLQVSSWNRPSIPDSWLHCIVLSWAINAYLCQRTISMRSGIESRWGRDFPPVQTGLGAHPASCKMGTGSIPGVKCGRGVLLTFPSF